MSRWVSHSVISSKDETKSLTELAFVGVVLFISPLYLSAAWRVRQNDASANASEVNQRTLSHGIRDGSASRWLGSHLNRPHAGLAVRSLSSISQAWSRV